MPTQSDMPRRQGGRPSASHDSVRSYLKLLLLLTAAALFLVAVGLVPTRRFAGSEGYAAMFAGIAISWVACAVAVLPLVGMDRAPTPHIRLTLSTGLRFFFVVTLTGSLLLSGWFAMAPLLIWVGISYFVLLMIDAGFAMLRVGGFTVGKTLPDRPLAAGNTSAEQT